MYTLAIVDMQWYFGASRKASVIAACKREINKAMKARAGILFVEYANCRSTISSLKKMTRDAGYTKAITVTKSDDDGSREILNAIRASKFNDKKIKVAGVNTCYCVQSTVQGLSQGSKRPAIEVIADACNAPTSHAHNSGLNAMSRFRNVSIK
jgi:hypothetical protein